MLAGCAAHDGSRGAGSGGAEPVPTPTPLATGHVVSPVQSLADPALSYAVFLPGDYSPARRWPVLFVLDPRGRGAFAAQLFQQAPERHGWIVMSSNDTRSDGAWEPNVRAMKAMLADADARFAVDPRRLYLAGFSGTARGAWALALGMKPNAVGVLLAGGGAPHESPPARGLPFAVFGSAGTRDFNYLEMRDLDAKLDEAGAAHRFATFDGEHEWPPPAVASEAIAWLELRAMRRGLAPPDEKLADELHDRWVAGARAAESAGSLVDAAHAWREMERDFAGTETAREAHAEVERLTGLPAFQRERDERERAERWERARREEIERLMSTLASAGSIDEDGTIARVRELHHSLRARASDTSDVSLAAGARRAIEHLASFVAFYTPRELSARHAYARATRVLELALTIHPDDELVWYNLACARARDGQRERALDALEQAIARGFHDRELLEHDDDLRSLRDTPRYRELLEQWRGPVP